MPWFKAIFLIVGAYVAVFVQAYTPGIRAFLNTPIDLLSGLMVYAALSSPLPLLTALAVSGGLFLDSLSANPLGVSILPLFVVGLILHLKRDLILRDQLFAQWVLGLSATLATPLFTLLLLFGTGYKPLFGWGAIWKICFAALLGSCFTPVWFGLFHLLQRKLDYARVQESAYSQDREIDRGR